MSEWLVERGIGETRAALIDNDEIIEARIQLEGVIGAGSVVPARLVDIGINGRNAIALAQGGIEYLLPQGAAGVTQGATLNIEVTREAIPGAEPSKRPLAKTTPAQPKDAPALAGRELPFAGSADTLGKSGWNDLLEGASSGIVGFAGGELHISPTPAMTLIDVDGYLPPDQLVVLGAFAAARSIRRLDIGGSIGIDLPTCRSKAARQQAAAALDSMLPQPFERTSVNGFGFVQIVRPRLRPSLVELAQDRAPFEARALLRRAAFEPPGPKLLIAPPAVIAVLEKRNDWLGALARRIGGAVELRPDPALPMSGGYATSL